MIDISPAAVAEIRRIQLNQKDPDAYLRLAIKSGGCLGFFYDLALESSETIENKESRQDDYLLEVNGINCVIDPYSWKYLEFLKLDYAEDLMGGGFRFHNHQVKKTCGCGISFSVENL